MNYYCRQTDWLAFNLIIAILKWIKVDARRSSRRFKQLISIRITLNRLKKSNKVKCQQRTQRGTPQPGVGEKKYNWVFGATTNKVSTTFSCHNNNRVDIEGVDGQRRLSNLIQILKSKEESINLLRVAFLSVVVEPKRQLISWKQLRAKSIKFIQATTAAVLTPLFGLVQIPTVWNGLKDAAILRYFIKPTRNATLITREMRFLLCT